MLKTRSITLTTLNQFCEMFDGDIADIVYPVWIEKDYVTIRYLNTDK